MNRPATYSMFKPAGAGWTDETLHVVVVESSGGAVLEVTDSATSLSKTYPSRAMGEVYDNFLWLASKERIDTRTLTLAGFSGTAL